MKQSTFATNGFNKYLKKTRRAVFLNEMNQVVPGTTLYELIEPHYPKAGNGRPPIGLGLESAPDETTVCKFLVAPSLMRPSLPPPLRPRIPLVNVIRKYVRRRKEINGTLV